MSPQDRLSRPAGAWLGMSGAGLVTVALVWGLGVAMAPASAGAGTLSEAAKQALKPPEKQQPIPVADKVPDVVVAATTILCTSPPVPLPPPPPPGPYPLPPGDPHHDFLEYQSPTSRPLVHVGPVVAVHELSSPDFATSTFAGVRFGVSRGGRSTFDLSLLGGPARFTAGSDLARALRDAFEGGFEGSFRYSFTPPRSALAIGPVVGFRVGHLTWRYQYPIQLETPEMVWTVDDDAIWHYSPYVGIATSIVNTRHADLGVTALVGNRFYASESHQGLLNDLFPDTWFRELRFEARIVF